MKSEVGMAVLKSKLTRVVGVISTYICTDYPLYSKGKCRDVLYVCADIPYYSCLFAF